MKSVSRTVKNAKDYRKHLTEHFVLNDMLCLFSLSLTDKILFFVQNEGTKHNTPMNIGKCKVERVNCCEAGFFLLHTESIFT